MMTCVEARKQITLKHSFLEKNVENHTLNHQLFVCLLFDEIDVTQPYFTDDRNTDISSRNKKL